jgi:transcriptional regulator with XRE-family HTH domain
MALTTPCAGIDKRCVMPRPARIHAGKQPRRLHFIVEWARRRQVKQADIGRDLEVDKSTVSRWFDGTIPSEAHLVALAQFLGADEPTALFRHPDDDWMARFLRGRSEDERRRIRATLETAFPPKRGEAA